jgi:hypothetical protein
MNVTKVTRTLAIACAITLGGYASGVRAATIAYWTFETSNPTTAGPHVAEAGVEAATSEAMGGTGGTYSAPAGNGNGSTSLHSFSSNGWDVGDYWQFKFPTTGYSGLTLTFDQAGSNTGPKDFKVQTSPDGSTFTDLPSSAYTVIASTWNTNATPMPGFSHSFGLPASLENLAFGYVRLVNTSTVSINNGTVGSGGTDRVDNVQITTAEVPEPAMLSLLGIGLAALGLVRRR